MQDFSPLGNFINSFLKHQASRAASNIVVGANHPSAQISPQANTPGAVLPRQTAAQQAAANTQIVMAQMDSAERALLIKDLLNLPSTLSELVSTLQTGKQGTLQNSQFTNLQNLNVADLMALMQTNGKDALAKIMQLTNMLHKTGNVNTKELQELQFVVNACMPNATTSNTQFMKNLILLYLPWLPIGENNNFDIEFSSSEENAGSEADDIITILIQTENYGNVKVLLVLESANKISMSVNCAKIFPKELLQEKLKKASNEYKLQTEMAVIEHETVDKAELGQKKIHMSGAAVLNPYVLLMAHAVIKTVIEIDKSQSLTISRKKAAK